MLYRDPQYDECTDVLEFVVARCTLCNKELRAWEAATNIWVTFEFENGDMVNACDECLADPDIVRIRRSDGLLEERPVDLEE